MDRNALYTYLNANEENSQDLELLQYVGLLFIPYVLLVGWIGLRDAVPRGAVWAVIACNLAWASSSIVLLTGGSIAPSNLGVAFVLVQVVAVVVLAESQFTGLRRSAVSA